jgi:hypothetical protein
MLKGRNVSLQGAFNFSKRYISRIFSPSYRENAKKWKSLKGKFKGHRVFLIGNGPSLNKTPLYLLKDEYTMSFNRFGLMTERFCWAPSFFAMSDMTVIEDSQDYILNAIDKAQYSFFLSNNEGEWKVEDVLPERDNILYFMFEGRDFSKKLPRIRSGGTVAIGGLQILNYLGFDEIIIIGMDMNYVVSKSIELLDVKKSGEQKIQSKADDDPNHFDPRYFGKGAKYTNPNENELTIMFTALREASEWFEKKTKTKVYNAGYDSKVESFPKKDFMDVLGYSEATIKELFQEVVQSHGFISVEDLISKAFICEKGSEFDESREVISLPVNEGALIVKKVILSYIPIGPYKDRIYFIKRK